MGTRQNCRNVSAAEQAHVFLVGAVAFADEHRAGPKPRTCESGAPRRWAESSSAGWAAAEDAGDHDRPEVSRVEGMRRVLGEERGLSGRCGRRRGPRAVVPALVSP